MKDFVLKLETTRTPLKKPVKRGPFAKNYKKKINLSAKKRIIEKY